MTALLRLGNLGNECGRRRPRPRCPRRRCAGSFFAAFLPQFMSPGAPAMLQSMLLGSFISLGLFTALAGSRATR